MWTSGCGERMRAEHPDPEVAETGEEPDSGAAGGRGTDSEQDGGAAGSGGRDRMAEELGLLLDAAAWRAEEYLRGGGERTRDRSAEPSGETTSGGAASCGWCPICAVAALVRGDQPELTTKLADQLSGLVELLRGTLAQHRHAESADPPPETAEPAAERAGKVQRIEVRRVRGKTTAAAGHGAAAGHDAAGHGGPTGERDC